MEKRGKAGIVISIIITVLGALLAIGAQTFFKACGVKEDGSWMTCHWAGQVSCMLGIVIAVQGIISLLIKNKKAQGAVFLSIAPVSLLCCFIPGTVISLCAMSGMHCRSVLRPAVIIIGVIVTAVSLCGALYGLKGEKEDE